MAPLQQEIELTVDVASRLRQLRKQSGLSMRTLAGLSGLSANALSVIERGKSSPSVNTLLKIAEALGIPVTSLLTQPATRQKVIFIKADERTCVKIQLGVCENLGGDQFNGHIKPYLFTLENGANSPTGMLHPGDEFIFCLSGNLEVQVEEEVYDLKAGDSLLFQLNLPHRWRSKGIHETKALLVVSEYTGEGRLATILK